MNEEKFQQFLKENPDYKNLPRGDQLVLYGNYLTVQALGDPETVVGVLGKYPKAAEAVRKHLSTDPEMRKYFEQDPSMADFYRRQFGGQHPPAEKAEAKVQHDWDIIHAQTGALLRELAQLGLIIPSELEGMPEVPATFSPKARTLIAEALQKIKEKHKRLEERRMEIAEGFAKEEERFFNLWEQHGREAYDRAVEAGFKLELPPNRKVVKPDEYFSILLRYLDSVGSLLYKFPR